MYEEVDKRINEIRDKWNAIAEEQGYTTDDVDAFVAKNHEMVFNDLFELLDMCSPDKIVVENEDGNVLCSTDFTDESKNLEVWKAIGLDEEDFYKQ